LETDQENDYYQGATYLEHTDAVRLLLLVGKRNAGGGRGERSAVSAQ
jgi:hypothetical protein